jgi:pyruvate dehydrogenase E1 component beta subunit/2-oxoisovalerate dehydrogenase E1 component beta subunit
MTPATVEDAYTMLLEAIKVDDPVIFCEHKYLYNRLKIEALPDTNLPFDTARIARPGRDISIVAYSSMVHEALSAAELLHKANIEAEVVDLRCIKPLDVKTVLESVARTARLLCVGESWPWGGVNSEVIASVVTHGFHLLDAPPQRINSKDTPVPFHPNLLGAHKPSSQVIAAAARRLCDW